jgi:GT2 family glycosyltransferase
MNAGTMEVAGTSQSAKTGPKIGVVTVTYNSASVLSPFLACIFAQDLVDFILYVVDNKSSDETVELLTGVDDPRLKCIVNSKNVGVAEGNNQGIRAALDDRCETILLVNNDTEFPPNLFTVLYEGLDQYGTAMTTGKMMYFYPSEKIWCAGGWLDSARFYNARHNGMNEMDRGQYEQARRITYSPTCLLLVRRSVFENVGLMDSRYFVYNDDVDFLYRCLKKEQSLWYLPNAVLYHKVSALTGGDESDFAIRFMTRNRTYFLRKHMPAWKVALWVLHFIVVTAPRRVLERRDSIRIWRMRCASLAEGWRMARESKASQKTAT